MDYASIKDQARQQGCRITDLIALAPQNDPFYTGTPADLALAEWFADLWNRFGYTKGVHIRRVHYQVVSQSPVVILPNGKPYENTEACWDALNMAAKAARYLGLVDPAAFVDRRNPEARIFTADDTPYPEVWITGNLWNLPELPDFPALPCYELSGYTGRQRYHLEIWCEKSTMNDVLLPICDIYGANLQTGLGELSITATLAAVNRIAESGKPARIFYVSDFDPAGQSMPVAVARKLEYFIRRDDIDADVRLFPLVLSQEQVQHYNLPRTPIKESEKRRTGFEDRYGTGAVELDALEALYPGELNTILRKAIEAVYFDPALDTSVFHAYQQVYHDLHEIQNEVIAGYASDIVALRKAYEQIRSDFTQRLEGHTSELVRVWQAISMDLEERKPNVLADYPIPEPADVNEYEPGLYNTTWDYYTQLESYKVFQGKE